MVRQPVVGVNRIRTGIGRASCTDAGSILFAAIAIALGQQITSGPPGCMAADPWDGLADLAKLAASRWTLARSSSSASTKAVPNFPISAAGSIHDQLLFM